MASSISLHNNKLVQSTLCCRRSTNQPADLPFQSSLSSEQDLKILQFLHLRYLRQHLIPNLRREKFVPFLPENNGLRFKGADSHPHSSARLRSRLDEANRTASLAKCRDLILRSPVQTSSTPWLQIKIMSINVMKRITYKGQI